MVSKQKEIRGDLWFYLSSSRTRQNCFPQLGSGWGSFAGRFQGMVTHSKHGSKTVSLAAVQDESGKRPRQSSGSIAVGSGDARLQETGGEHLFSLILRGTGRKLCAFQVTVAPSFYFIMSWLISELILDISRTVITGTFYREKN